jgi:AcrR family transcriptional regulator
MSPHATAPLDAARRGRPRSERARRAVLDAAGRLFAEGGYPAATIEAIAARSGVAKTTIYRWWPHRAALMVELLLRMAAEAAPPPAGADPVRALRTELNRVAEASDAPPGRLLLSLLGESQRDPDVRGALLDGLFTPRRRASAEVVRQAQQLGVFRKEDSPFLATDLLFGPLFYRRFVRQEPVTPAYVRQMFELALAGLATGSRTPVTPGRRPRARRRP